MKSVRVGSIAGYLSLLALRGSSPSPSLSGPFPSYLPGHVEDAPAAVYVAMAVASALLFFVSLVLHELAHSLVARRYGIPFVASRCFC